TERGVDDLLRTNAASLGGIMAAKGRPGFQEAVARAYNSRFGLGGGAYHGESAHEGPAESAYMGIFRRDILDQVGGFDETLRRGEDWELNYRLRTAGHIVWLDPGLRVSYWPRSTPGKLARQFRATGIWRGELVRRLGRGNSSRFFAPPLLLVNLVVAVPVLVLHLTGVLSGWLGWVAALAYVGPVAYLALLVIAAVSSTGTLADRLRFAAVLAIMHLSWGAGFIVGLVRGAGDAVDTSRTES
ncbi:MAG: glycosyltransferase family 2 protein, partial [Pseudolysinimonas sp.]